MNRVLTREEVAELLRVSVDTIDRLVASGSLPSFRVGRNVRFNEADLEAWVASQKRPAARAASPAPYVPRRKAKGMATSPKAEAILARLRRR